MTINGGGLSTLVAFMTATTSGMLPSPDSNPQKPIPPKKSKAT
jgi:hypothetical protein